MATTTTMDEKTAAQFSELGEDIEALASKMDAERDAILTEHKSFVDLINEARRNEDWKLAAEGCRALANIFRDRGREGLAGQYAQRANDYDDLSRSAKRRLRTRRGARGAR